MVSSTCMQSQHNFCNSQGDFILFQIILHRLNDIAVGMHPNK